MACLGATSERAAEIDRREESPDGAVPIGVRRLGDDWRRIEDAGHLSLRHRLKRRYHSLRREGDDDLGALAQLRLQRKGSSMQLDQTFYDRKAEAGALFGGFDCIRALAERIEHDRNLVLRNAGPGVLDAEVLAACRG